MEHNSILMGLSKKYKTLTLAINYSEQQWSIGVKDALSNETSTNSLLENDRDNYNLLYDLMPGTVMGDFYGGIAGQSSHDACHTYATSETKILYYHGQVYSDGLCIKEKVFDCALDFYAFIFSCLNDVVLGAKELDRLGIEKPIDVLPAAFRKEGYEWFGFKYSGSDSSGFSYCVMVLKDNTGKEILVKYPTDDISVPNDFVSVDDVTFKYYTSDLGELMEAAKAGDLKSFISLNRIAEQ